MQSHQDIAMDQFKEGGGKDGQGPKGKRQLDFKVMRDIKRKPKSKKNRVDYTLDCERRLTNLKRELTANLDNQIDILGGQFEHHYQKVINRTRYDYNTKQRMRFQRATEPEGNYKIDFTKGRYMFDQNDVMQLPIMHLNEETIKEVYGERKLAQQDFAKIAGNDELTRKLLSTTSSNIGAQG